MGENLFILLTPANAMDTIQILLWGDIFHFSDIVCEKYKEKLYSREPGGFGGLLAGGFFCISALSHVSKLQIWSYSSGGHVPMSLVLEINFSFSVLT